MIRPGKKVATNALTLSFWSWLYARAAWQYLLQMVVAND